MGFLSGLFGGDAPDTSGINQAALTTAQLGKDQLDWFKKIYEEQAPERAAAAERAGRVADAQVEGMNFATQEARDLSQRNKTVFQPLEDKIVSSAQAFDTPERRAQAAAEARADVEQSFGGAQDAMSRALRRTGGTMGGRMLTSMSDWALNKAKANAGASTQAVKNVEQQGYARQMDAAGLGRGVVGNQATMQGIATQSGAGAVNAGGAALAAGNAGLPSMQQAFQTGIQGAQAAGNLYGQAAKLEAGDGAGMAQGIGSLMQGAGAIFGKSSKALKTEKRDIDENAALEAVNAVPVEGWKYKDGVADEGTHIGPYAQDVQKASGNAMAPRGVMVSMSGLAKQNGGAIQALDRKLDALLEEVKSLEAEGAK